MRIQLMLTVFGLRCRLSAISRKETIAAYMPSSREVKLLELWAIGLGVILIADELHISTHTINQHLLSIYRELKVRSRGMAERLAQRVGILNA